MSEVTEALELTKKAPYYGNDPQALTSTSAQFVANKAKEIFESLEKENSNISFLNVTYQVIGHESKTVTATSDAETFTRIKTNLSRIGKLKALIAWLREGVNLKKSMNDELRNYSLSDYLSDNNLELLKSPSKRILTPDFVKSEIFSVKEYQRYLELEAEAANLGTFIHKNGVLNKARQEFHNKRGRTEVKGEGSEMTFIEYTAATDPNTLESNFMELQELYRKIQAEFNGMKHRVELKLNEMQNDIDAKYRNELQENNNKVKEYSEARDKFIKEQSAIISELKIIIPESLKSIYEFVRTN